MEQVIRKSKAASWYALIVRIVLGVVFIVHGQGKVFSDLQPENLNETQLSQLVDMEVISGDKADAEGLKKQVAAARPAALYGLALTIHNSGNLKRLEEYPTFKPVVGFLRDYAVPLAWAAAISEFFGGICMLLGLLTRIWALALFGTMFMAVVMVHWNSDVGFNIFDPGWQIGGGGWEYNFVLGMLAIAVFFGGPGKLSLDRLIFRRRKEQYTPAQGGITSGSSGGGRSSSGGRSRGNLPPNPPTQQQPRIVSQNLPGQGNYTQQAAPRPVNVPPQNRPSPPPPSPPPASSPTKPPEKPAQGNPPSEQDQTPGEEQNPGENKPGPRQKNPGDPNGTGNHGLRPPKKDEEPPTRPI